MEDVPERQRHICIIRTKIGIRRARELLGSTNGSGCKVEASANCALTHLFSAEEDLFLLLTTAAGPAGVPRGLHDPCR